MFTSGGVTLSCVFFCVLIKKGELGSKSIFFLMEMSLAIVEISYLALELISCLVIKISGKASFFGDVDCDMVGHEALSER